MVRQINWEAEVSQNPEARERDVQSERWTVELRSATYGTEEFKYDSLKDALAGLERLTRSSLLAYASDGIRRRIAIVVGYR